MTVFLINVLLVIAGGMTGYIAKQACDKRTEPLLMTAFALMYFIGLSVGINNF